MTNQCSDHKCQQIGVPSSCSWGRLTTSARIKEGVMGALFKYALSNIRRPLLHPKFPTSQGESSTYVDLQTQFRNKGPSSSEEDNLGDSYTTASAGSRGSAHMNIVPKGTQPESRNLHHQSQNPVTNRHDLPDHIDNVRCLPTAKPARAISIKCARFWGTWLALWTEPSRAMSKYDKGGAFGDGPGSPSGKLENRHNRKWLPSRVSPVIKEKNGTKKKWEHFLPITNLTSLSKRGGLTTSQGRWFKGKRNWKNLRASKWPSVGKGGEIIMKFPPV